MNKLSAACLLLALGAASPAALATTYTVTTTADSGPGSLRQAILDANANAGTDAIHFAIPGADPGCDGNGVCTIAPLSPLHSIDEAVTIDGYTQTGATPNSNAQGAINAVLKVVLSGVNVVGTSALFVDGAGTTIRGLVVNGGFDQTVTFSLADNGAVKGCFVGTDAAGMAAVPNNRGVYVAASAQFSLGGPLPADRNLISGNGGHAVMLLNCPNANVEANLIGTDATGAAPLGNGGRGIFINPGRAGMLIHGNVIAANHDVGLNTGDIGGDTEFGITIQGNFIGTDVTGTVPLGNTPFGVFVTSNQVTVGGVNPGEGNVIAFNAGAGVYVLDGGGSTGPHQSPIRGNAIYENGQTSPASSALGIDLGEPGVGVGVTINDLGDADIGPNDRQNFPVITSAVSAAGSTTIQGTLNSLPNKTYDIDFYGNPICSPRPQGYRQGQTYLGSAQATTNGNGDAVIDAVLAGVTIDAGTPVTATATDPNGNTSEFSQRIVLTSVPPSGPAAGGTPLSLTGFNFLAGATVSVGGAPATNVVVQNYNLITADSPALGPGTLNDITVSNTDGSAGTLPNGWIADFLDVPPSQQFYSFVSTLVRNEITVGIGGGLYGVGDPTLRRQMAVFLLKAKHGVCYVPPPCSGMFADVPCPSTFANWIEAMANEGITGGCGGSNFCPTNPVRRDQMAVFLLKAEHGSGYVPPACAGIFADVPCPSTFANWIEQLSAEQITGGCGNGNYCPLSNNTRGQMAVFITKTFNLQ